MRYLGRLKNNRGFGLIEVLMVAAILSMVSLGISTLIISQANQASLIEDKVSYSNLKLELERLVQESTAGCTASLSGLTVKKNKDKETTVTSLRDDRNKVIFATNNAKKEYDFLEIKSINMKDVDVHKNGGSGTVNITVDIKRKRSGSGLTYLKPIELTQTVEIDKNDRVVDCKGTLSAETDYSCVTQEFKRYIDDNAETGDFTLNNSYSAIVFERPDSTTSYRDDGDERTCYHKGFRYVIYPGETLKSNGKPFKKGARVVVKRGAGVEYKWETNSGNRRSDTFYPTEYYLDGELLYYEMNATKCTQKHGRAPHLEANALPGPCAVKNGRYIANKPYNFGFSFYSSPGASK